MAREKLFSPGAGRDANEAAHDNKGSATASDALKKVQQYWKQ
jgi:hypothetical protein